MWVTYIEKSRNLKKRMTSNKKINCTYLRLVGNPDGKQITKHLRKSTSYLIDGSAKKETTTTIFKEFLLVFDNQWMIALCNVMARVIFNSHFHLKK